MADRLWALARDGSRVLLRHPLLFLLVLLVGGFSGFLYTSGPLHAAKNWRLDYVDTQLAIQNQRVRTLETALVQRNLAAQGSLAPAEATLLRAELARAATQGDQQLERVAAAEKKAEQAYQSRDRWRTKYRDAEGQLSRSLDEKTLLATERDRLLARLSAVGSHSAPPAAAVDLNSTVLARDLELMVGESWSSPDGRVHFDVVDVDKEVASLRGSWQADSAEPERVAAGRELRASYSDATYRISVIAVSPYRSLTIRAVSGPP